MDHWMKRFSFNIRFVNIINSRKNIYCAYMIITYCQKKNIGLLCFVLFVWFLFSIQTKKKEERTSLSFCFREPLSFGPRAFIFLRVWNFFFRFHSLYVLFSYPFLDYYWFVSPFLFWSSSSSIISRIFCFVSFLKFIF